MLFINRANLLGKLNKIYLWGTGEIAAWITEQFEEEICKLKICGFIDSDERKQGRTFRGYMIYSPQVLEENKDCHIIILSNYWQEILEQIKTNYSENVCRCESYHFFIKYRMIPRYQDNKDEDIQETLNYIRNGSLAVFNYPFTESYYNVNYNIEYDDQKQMYYTFVFEKRMYFSRKYVNKFEVENYLRQIMMEQDRSSPHCYFTDDFQVDENSVVLDAGVAEGNFSLSIIDRVKKIYLVEPDKEWIEALEYTFEPYRDKIVIINKYLSNYVSKETTTIDDIVDGELDFIKMDIEGEEFFALQGASDVIINSDKIKCVVCTYHQEFDYVIIKNLLHNMGLETETSRGYMWFPYDKNYFYSLPTLRRGLIRAEKSENEK